MNIRSIGLFKLLKNRVTHTCLMTLVEALSHESMGSRGAGPEDVPSFKASLSDDII